MNRTHTYTFAGAEVGDAVSDIVTVKLAPGSENYKPDLFPGSGEALDAGCTCPADQPWPGGFLFATNCPVHELQRAPS